LLYKSKLCIKKLETNHHQAAVICFIRSCPLAMTQQSICSIPNRPLQLPAPFWLLLQQEITVVVVMTTELWHMQMCYCKDCKTCSFKKIWYHHTED